MALKQGKSIPLQEDIDPDYEPSAEGPLNWPLGSALQQQVSNLFVSLQRLLTMLSGLGWILKQKRSLCGFARKG